MSQREYLWCGDASFADQSAEDVITRASTPVQIRSGAFAMSFAQQSKIEVAGHQHTLLTIGDTPEFEIRVVPVSAITDTRGTSKVVVSSSAGTLVESPDFTHTKGRAVHFGFDASAGRVTVEGGHEEAATSTEGTPWDIADSLLTLGGSGVGTGQSARGNVSLPYLRTSDASIEEMFEDDEAMFEDSEAMVET